MDLLIDQEWEDRQSEKMKRMVQAAKFRVNATLSEIDYKSNRGLDRDMLKRLGTLDFIKQKQNIILTCPSGVGKSYLAQAIGHQACIQGNKCFYQNTSRFLAILKFAKMEGSYLKRLKSLSRVTVLILDDFGLQSLDKVERESLMDIIDDRYDRKSTIIPLRFLLASGSRLSGRVP